MRRGEYWWNVREWHVAGPGSNRSRARARRKAQKMGNRRNRRKGLDSVREWE